MSKDRIRQLEQTVEYLTRRIEELTPSLETILQRRGFILHKKGSEESVLIPDDTFLPEYFEMMKRYAFRLFLRDIIKYCDGFTLTEVVHYATREVTREYIEYMLNIGLIERVDHDRYRLRRRDLLSFGETLEWFVAETLRRQYHMQTLWNVRFRGRGVGGDYDLLAKLNGGLLYIEVKSSPPRQIYDRDIGAFLRRIEDLCPEMAVFLVDTHLRMRDKIIPMFEDLLKDSHFKGTPKRLKAEIYTLENWLYIINSRPSIEGNLGYILSHYYRRRCR